MPPFHRRVGKVCIEWFMAIVTALAVSLAWRGAWVMMDALLVPECPLVSAAAGLGFGAVGYMFIVAFAPLARRWQGDARPRDGNSVPSKWWMSIGMTIYNYFGVWVCIAIWRGAWELWDHAFGIPERFAGSNRTVALSGLTSHVFGMAITVTLDAFHLVPAPPVDNSPNMFQNLGSATLLVSEEGPDEQAHTAIARHERGLVHNLETVTQYRLQS